MAAIPLPNQTGVAVVTMECQRGVIGDLAIFPAVRDAAVESGTIAAIARLIVAARRRDIPVLHAVFGFEDGPEIGGLNAPLLRSAADAPIMAGSDAAELVPDIGGAHGDPVSSRSSGVSPFTGTDLHQMLSRLDVDTLIVCGVSLNVGIPGLCIEAVNLGYQVVVPTDAVVGVPRRYGDDVLRFTIAQLATLCSVDDLDAGWSTTG